MDSSHKWCRTIYRTIFALLVIILAGFGMRLPAQYEHDIVLAASRLAANQVETVYIPAIVVSSVEATATATPTASSTPIRVPTTFATASPTPRPAETSTAEPTPTPTAITTDMLRFEGTSNQGRRVIVETLSDLLAVTKFEIDAVISCPNSSGDVEVRVADQIGYKIENNRFRISVKSPGGNEHVFSGTVDSDGSQMNGTWSIWRDAAGPLPPCNDKGTWSAVRQTP